MRSIKMTTGADLVLDGDLLSLVEMLYIEVSAKHELQTNFEDMQRQGFVGYETRRVEVVDGA